MFTPDPVTEADPTPEWVETPARHQTPGDDDAAVEYHRGDKCDPPVETED